MAHPAIRRALAALVPAGLGAVAATLPVLAAAGSPTDTPGGKGAQVYCFMRGAGNSHEVSWTAAYSLIKRQSASLFKTSPEHAAVMITESVVNSPETYPDCGRFLGALYGSDKPAPIVTDIPASGNSTGPMAIPSSGGGTTRHDRYSY